ncbi:MAG: hypothetical protein WC293_06480 [Candidatus Omnitrophota bacterium]|jgi:hypothetical protein|nr:hypothetical protein [Candidatus Omnitrophota bacterium]
MKRMMKCQVFILLLIFLVNLTGCEAFVRKFTRKSKKDKAPEEMVLVPEEWTGPKMSKEEIYRRYYNFWQSWQEELINVLTQKASLKKRVDCAQQSIKNLSGMRSMLNVTKQKQLDVYLNLMNDLLISIKADIYGTANSSNRQKAERVKRNIMQSFSYPDIKGDLI